MVCFIIKEQQEAEREVEVQDVYLILKSTLRLDPIQLQQSR